jgi:hypothetical protein
VAALAQVAQSQSQIAPAALITSGVSWNPLMVSVVDGREPSSYENTRYVSRDDSGSLLQSVSELVSPTQNVSESSLSFSEPAKWTVISTGVVIWAIRLGHIITTFASTASAWIQFDPITLIHGNNKNDEDDQQSSLFDSRRKTPKAD